MDNMADERPTLRNTLLHRAQRAQAPPPALAAPKAPTGLPTGIPNAASRVPPAWKRYQTGLKMQDAYANNWQPNPMLIQALE